MAATGPTVISSIPGNASPTGCDVYSSIPDGTIDPTSDVYLAYTTTVPSDPDGFPDSEDYTFLASPVTGWVAIHLATGLKPYTQYYAGLCTLDSQTDPNWIGDPIRFKTLVDDTVTGSVTFKWALGSCQQWEGTRPSDGDCPVEIAWEDLKEFAPDLLWDIGDFHYQGGNGGADQIYGPDDDPLTWQQMYWDQIAALPCMRKVRATVVEDQIGDDHEFSTNNGESQYPWEGPAGSKYNRGYQRSWQMQGMQALFPMHATQGPGVGLYGDYTLTPNIRVVLTDGESLQRSPGEVAELEQDDKTFFGTDQDDWVIPLLTETQVPLNLVVSGKAWLGDDVAGTPASEHDYDKIWVYPAWRETFYNAMQHADPPVNLVWLGGDRHEVAYCSGPNNPWGGFPCLIGSAWAEFSLRPVDGENYDYAWPWNSPDYDPDTQWQLYQYVRGTLTDDMEGTITMTIEMRYQNPDTGLMDTLPTSEPIVLTWTYDA